MTRLDPRLLLQGYATGIFPMADSREAGELFWVEPRNRAIIPLESFHVSRSLKRTLRSGTFTVTHDRDFAGVIAAHLSWNWSRAVQLSVVPESAVAPLRRSRPTCSPPATSRQA